jgi:hypothetical protein
MSRFLCAATAALLSILPTLARADFHVRSPYEIDYGELELEHNGAAQFDHRHDQNGATSYTAEIGTGLTPWWHAEIELGWDRDPGGAEPTLLRQVVGESMVQLTEPGEAFADFGFYTEYGQSLTGRAHAESNELTLGPLIAKDIGRTTHTINLFVTRLLGPDKTTNGLDFSYAWQSRWNLYEALSPAVEIYGDTGTLGHMLPLSRQDLLAGPVVVGAVKFRDLGLGNAGKLKYELGWLFGATGASPQGTLRWRMEAEIPF